MRIIIINKPDPVLRRILREILDEIKEVQRTQKLILQIVRPKGKILIHLKGENISVKGEHVMVDFKKVGQFVDFELEILDSQVPPQRAEVDGPIVVTNSNEASFKVDLDQTTRLGRLTCLGGGIGHIDFTCDADRGEGVVPLVGVIDATGPDLTQASVFNVKVGAVQDPAPQA